MCFLTSDIGCQLDWTPSPPPRGSLKQKLGADIFRFDSPSAQTIGAEIFLIASACERRADCALHVAIRSYRSMGIFFPSQYDIYATPPQHIRHCLIQTVGGETRESMTGGVFF